MSDIIEKTGNIILYNTADGQVKINLHAIDGTVWLSQAQIAELFDKGRTTITEHISNIFKDDELDRKVVCRKFRHTTQHGAMFEKSQNQTTQYYSLDMILAVGFRVRSPRATQFRQWANSILQEYLVKGFAIDAEKLKSTDNIDYFAEWLELIRDIRSSEKRFYQKILDLYTTAVDYDPKSDKAKKFFTKVQNKMLWAITGHTAPELITDRSDPTKPNMGLTAWKGSVVRKSDVDTAKNYLSTDEVSELNRIITMYLDYAEDQAKKRKTISMQQWAEKLDIFLTFNERELLQNAGKIKVKIAKQLAHAKYEQFNTNRKKTDAEKAYKNDIAKIEKMVKNIENTRKSND